MPFVAAIDYVTDVIRQFGWPHCVLHG